MPADLILLGTGAAGGTEGSGRSARRESSAALEDGIVILLDVTHDMEGVDIDRCDAVLLTHGHADAIGGLGRLADAVAGGPRPIPVLARPKTLAVAHRRFRRLDHCDLRAFSPGDRTRIGDWTVTCRDVPHAADPDTFPTVAWKLTSRGRRLVYASDLAAPTSDLRSFARGPRCSWSTGPPTVGGSSPTCASTRTSR